LAREAIKNNNPNKAIQLVESMAENLDVDALIIIGEALLVNNDYAGAVEKMGLAKNYWKIIDIALRAEKEMDIDNAANAINKAYELDPENGALPYANFLQRNKQDPKDIEKLLVNALDNYPQSEYRSVWLQKKGDSLYEQERWEEALRAYEESISVNPNLGESYYGIAQVLVEQDNLSDADTWYQKAIALEPEKKWWILRRANAARDAGQIELAIILYEDIINRFPEFPQAYFEVSWAYKLDQKQDKAVQAIQTAIEKNKYLNQWFFIRAGKIYEWTDDLGNARNAFNKALEINPTNKTAILKLEKLRE
jgi:tetratricopeptide (TPR) repeat protein